MSPTPLTRVKSSAVVGKPLAFAWMFLPKVGQSIIRSGASGVCVADHLVQLPLGMLAIRPQLFLFDEVLDLGAIYGGIKKRQFAGSPSRPARPVFLVIALYVAW